MRGGGLTFCKNYKITIRIFRRKFEKKARTGCRNVWRRRPCSFLYLVRMSLKGEGAKMVTCLTNTRRPLLIKDDVSLIVIKR
jgi:hypothetical protein